MNTPLSSSSLVKRRIRISALIIFLIALLALSVAFRVTNAFALTPTLAIGGSFTGSPVSGTAPLLVQFTTSTYGATSCIWTFGDGSPTETYNIGSGSCPAVSHTYTSGGNFTVTLRLVRSGFATVPLTRTNYIQVTGPTPTITPSPTVGATLPDLSVVSITEYTYSIPTPTLNAQGCRPWTAGSAIGLTVTIQNTGTAASAPFRVMLNGNAQKDSPGIIAGGTNTVSFTNAGLPRTRTANVDILNEIAESDETNNSFTLVLPAATPTSTGTPRPTQCVATRTPTPTFTQGITETPTRTPTRTVSPTITRTPTRTFTPTNGPSLTPTPTTSSGTACSPVTSTISVPFTQDGAGAFCWQASSLGAYINSWNTNSVTINGVNFTNAYVPASSYPAPIGGLYYVVYSGSFSWSHLEVR